MPNCPNCKSKDVVKNGFIHNGNQNHKCKTCGRQFVEAPRQKIISEETKALIDKLLLEKIPLAGIARVCNASETWLQDYVNRKYEAIPRQVNVSAKKKGRLTIQCDEMWWSVSLSNCRLLAIKATNSGFGLLLMSKPTKLLGFILVIAPNKEPENFGILCQVSTVSVLSLTRIFGGLTLLYSLHSVTRLLERSLVKPIILSGLTVRCGNVCPD